MYYITTISSPNGKTDMCVSTSKAAMKSAIAVIQRKHPERTVQEPIEVVSILFCPVPVEGEKR